MDKTTGYRIELEGTGDVESFAKSILLIANLKSDKKGVIDFRTSSDTDRVTVIVSKDFKVSVLRLEEIQREEIIIYTLNYFDDLKEENQQVFNELSDNADADIHITADLNEIF